MGNEESNQPDSGQSSGGVNSGNSAQSNDDVRERLQALAGLLQGATLDRQNRVTVGNYVYNKDRANVLGKGGFGVVYKGKGLNDEPVAIKKIKAEGSTMMRYADQEAKILGDIKQLKHVNLVELLYLSKLETNIFIVMEFCDGGDLTGYIERKGKLDGDTAKSFCHQLTTAMYTLHEMNLMHRDLKPGNILMVNHPENQAPYDKQLKVADFGLARYLNNDSVAFSVLGTPYYSAPEVVLFKNYDHTCDLYSLGLILFEMLTGKLPFDLGGNNVSWVKFLNEGGDRTIASKLPNVEAKLKKLVCALIKIDKTERIKMQDFFDDEYFKDGFYSSWKKFQSFKTVIKTMASEKAN